MIKTGGENQSHFCLRTLLIDVFTLLNSSKSTRSGRMTEVSFFTRIVIHPGYFVLEFFLGYLESVAEDLFGWKPSQVDQKYRSVTTEDPEEGASSAQ